MQMFVKFAISGIEMCLYNQCQFLFSYQPPGRKWIAPSWDNTSEKAWTQEQLVKHSEYITYTIVCIGNKILTELQIPNCCKCLPKNYVMMK